MKLRGRNRQERVKFQMAGILLIVSVVFMLAFGMEITVEAASLSRNKVTVFQGQSFRLMLKGTSGKKKWKSSSPRIAKVDSIGEVKAQSPGICQIKVFSKGKTYSCRLVVKALRFEKPDRIMVRGRCQTLQFNYGKVTGVVWSSSNPDVADVRDGVITSKQPGKAVIQAIWNGVPVRCEITVKDNRPEHLTQAYAADESNRGKILLAGSSSMDYWLDALYAFAPYGVINNAIEGSTVKNWLFWYSHLITPYKPGAVVLYIGANDLGNGELISGEENAQNTIRLLDKISRSLKNIPVFYVSINPCWFRKGAWEKTSVSNQLVQKYCTGKKNLYYIDIVTAFIDSNGTPDPAYFQGDLIHPNERGYALWEQLVAKRVKQTLNILQREGWKKARKTQKKTKTQKK